MSANNPLEQIVFLEKLSLPGYVHAAVITVAIGVCAFVMLSDSAPFNFFETAILAITMLIAFFLVLLPKTVTTVDNFCVSVRRRFSFFYQIRFNEILHAEPSSFSAAQKKYGRLPLLASSLSLVCDTGVLVHLIEGKYSFVSSKREVELAEAVNTGRERAEQQKYV